MAALKKTRRPRGFCGRKVAITFSFRFDNQRRDIQNFVLHGIYDMLIGHIITDDCCKWVVDTRSVYEGKGADRTTVTINTVEG